MVNPVPTRTATINPFNAWGKIWSCQRNAQGYGRHTGIDLMAARGARVVAARPGVARRVFYGANLGRHQLLIQCDDGTADFYAHMSARALHGKRVAAGEWVGYVSDEGNAVGTHLHLERWRNQSGWTCSVQVDPTQSINWSPPRSPVGGFNPANLRLGRKSAEARVFNAKVWAYVQRWEPGWAKANQKAWMAESAGTFGTMTQRAMQVAYASLNRRNPRGWPANVTTTPPPSWPGPAFLKEIGVP